MPSVPLPLSLAGLWLSWLIEYGRSDARNFWGWVIERDAWGNSQLHGLGEGLWQEARTVSGWLSGHPCKQLESTRTRAYWLCAQPCAFSHLQNAPGSFWKPEQAWDLTASAAVSSSRILGQTESRAGRKLETLGCLRRKSRGCSSACASPPSQRHVCLSARGPPAAGGFWELHLAWCVNALGWSRRKSGMVCPVLALCPSGEAVVSEGRI